MKQGRLGIRKCLFSLRTDWKQHCSYIDTNYYIC